MYSRGLFVITLAVTTLQFSILSRRVHYARDTLVDERVAADTGDVLGSSASELKAATIGSPATPPWSHRSVHGAGAAGGHRAHPARCARCCALSPPFDYLRAGTPLHPVNLQWKDRTWLSGGAFSVVVRTLIVVAALAWVQLKVAGAACAIRGPGHAAPVGGGGRGTVATGAMVVIWAAARTVPGPLRRVVAGLGHPGRRYPGLLAGATPGVAPAVDRRGSPGCS